MRNDTNAVDAEERAAAVLLVVHLLLDGVKRVPRQISACHARLGARHLVLKPFEQRHCDRFGCLQNHVADKTIAHHHFDRIFEEMTALNITSEVERAFFQHLENFFR